MKDENFPVFRKVVDKKHYVNFHITYASFQCIALGAL